MPKLTIDGKEIEVPRGDQPHRGRARRPGSRCRTTATIPGLSIAGQCRLCMVDIEKTPRPTIACNTVATEGMVVHTETDAGDARRGSRSWSST